MSYFEAVPASGESTATLVRWNTAEPGPELASFLIELEHEGLEHLDDFDAVEFVAAAERVASWAHHLAASAAASLSTREVLQPRKAAQVAAGMSSERLAGEELAMRLGRSPRAGQRLVRDGIGFQRELAATGESLRTGEIDLPKARAIAQALEEVPVPLALGVQDAVLPRAPKRTARQLANDVRAALVEIDPVEAAGRRERATERRYVSRPVALPDGMAGLWLRTNAVETHALWESIDTAARSARKAGDPRTLDQLRADLLVARGRRDGRRCDGSQSAGHSPGGSGREGAASDQHCGCRAGITADVRVLVPFSTLIGASDEAAELVGYGPIDPAMARALALGGTWRRLVTDPSSGTVLDVGRTSYRPPAGLADLVRFRDRTCVRPGCSATAWSCELDHTIPYRESRSEGGRTAADNLGPLSKGCHDLKTHGGFGLAQVAPGKFWWTTPTGHRYVHEPSAPVRAMNARDPIHELRAEFAALDPPPEPPGEPPSDPADEHPGEPPGESRGELPVDPMTRQPDDPPF